MATEPNADALKLLRQLVEPCEGTSEHSWRKCRRCIAIHGVENRFSLSMRLLQSAIDGLDQLASVSEGLANLQKEHEMLRASEPFTASGTTGSPRSPQPEGSVLSALRQRLEPVARREHYQAVGASALFSVEHWKHNAGPEWPHEPDDDSFTAFENCKHPLCAAVRPDDPVRIGAFDYTENADGTITRKDWRQP